MINRKMHQRLEIFCKSICTTKLGWSRKKREGCREHTMCDGCKREMRVLNYSPGKGCKCYAGNSDDCGCDVDWTPRIRKLVEVWESMSDSEMRGRLGEMTEQEIHKVKQVLRLILSDTGSGICV